MKELRKESIDPLNAKRVRSAFGGSRQHDLSDRDRIAAELGARFKALTPERTKETRPLSPVEKAMRRNAPDLAGGTETEIAAARARRRAHHYAKWPRPRLGALIVLMLAAALQPSVLLWLALWALILFLVTSVAVGPERARDYSKEIWRRFVGLWKHEIIFARKAMAALRDRIAIWGRSAL
jgi:hypothetical protein